MVNKELVKRRFEKSIETYPENAIVQKQMAENLVTNLLELQGNNFDKILEIGCGAGVLTNNILGNFNFKELFVNDITEAAQKKINNLSKDIKFIPGDCETISLPEGLDLVISNSTFQWVNNLELLLDEISNDLNKKGVIAFTTFGEQNLYQIKSITGKSLNYHDKKNTENILNKNFEIVHSHSEIVNLEFNCANDILRHLKLSGVNSLESIKWTRNDLKIFGDKYDKYYTNANGKLILTYHPISFIAMHKTY